MAGLGGPERRAETAAAELVQVFSHRNAVPVELWDLLIKEASETAEILVHAALFLVERPLRIHHAVNLKKTYFTLTIRP